VSRRHTDVFGHRKTDRDNEAESSTYVADGAW